VAAIPGASWSVKTRRVSASISTSPSSRATRIERASASVTRSERVSTRTGTNPSPGASVASSRATSVAETTTSVGARCDGSRYTSTSPSSWWYVRVPGRPDARISAASRTAASSNSAHPSVPCTSPPGTIRIEFPTAHGGEPCTLTALASTEPTATAPCLGS
jgi:hypothetical protein